MNDEEFQKAPDKKTKQDLVEKAWDEWSAFLLFDGINKNKYGTLYNEIRQQYTRGVDQYPRDTMVVIDMVGDRKIDQKYYDVKKAKAEKQKAKKSNQEKSSAQGTSFKQIQSAKKEIICHCCGCLLYTSPSPRDGATSRMPSSA